MKALFNRIISIFLLGTTDRYSLSENRITIFCNVLAFFGATAALLSYLQLAHLKIEGYYPVSYFLMAGSAFFLALLNFKGHHILARVLSVLILNLTAWHALIFFGKSFNGYNLFFVAIVFSVIAFPSKYSNVRWVMLAISLLGLPLSDYFSYQGILPITKLNSSQFPLSVLILDTVIVSGLLMFILLIERFLSEDNERELKALNTDLELNVTKRTLMLNEAKQEALAANKAKSRFIANTSHELRTPLGAIIGYVELLLDTNPNEIDRRKYLEVIRRSGSQLLQIVNEVLDMSKIEAEKLEIDNQEFNLNELINEVHELMALKAENKGLILTIKTSPLLLNISVYSDPLRLKQILVNLIGNAIKFTPRGEIKVDVQLFKKTDSQVSLICDISDTGPGIDAEQIKHLFEPFSQGDNTLVRKHGGSGLGLALSKNLAKLLNGDLILHSTEVGQGTTFRLTIDCSLATTKSTADNKESLKQSPSSKQSLLGKKILVVDDSIDNQILASQFLTLVGAEVDIAENGQNAIRLITKNPNYDAVLMDLQMPVLDGYETTRTLREQGWQMPIIAFTAHAMKEERDNAKKSGFDSYLTKPIRRQNLISTLENILLT